MLLELSIRNYALVDNLSLDFEGGLNIISGETGAGKSIIIGALGFLLGGKAATDAIRAGAEELAVSAVISISHEAGEAFAWLKNHDIPLLSYPSGSAEDADTLPLSIVVRRNLKSSGRSSMYIEDIPVSRAEAADFLSLLFDIHGQHEHESLLRRETHRKYLDRFAGIEAEVAEFNVVFQKLSEKRKMLDSFITGEREKKARLEILNFEVEEINKAALKTGESRQLEAEQGRLASFEKLAGHIDTASLALFDGHEASLYGVRKAKSALESAAAIDATLSPLSSRLTALYFEAEDLSGELRSYRDKLSFDPDRLEFTQERLSQIQKLKKKYVKNKGAGASDAAGAAGAAAENINIEEMILNAKREAEAEIEALNANEESKGALSNEIAALERDIAKRARDLSAARRAASGVLSEKISSILGELGMAGALFSVSLSAKERERGASATQATPVSVTPVSATPATIVCGPFGADDAEFLISANKGEPLKELSRIASGGELSRVMLAIKTVLAAGNSAGRPTGSPAGSPARDNTPGTLIFDEIDAGIGGEVANTVGKYLLKIAKNKQIFCITHLASIAALADNHLLVEKKSGESRTVTTVHKLSKEDRRGEIARMLSGDRDGVALRHAEELLTKYGN
jgi:DNA repair protein RecN (Recombination protein N)